MNEQLDKFWAVLVAVVLIPLIAFFSRRDLSRFDKGLDRVAKLERDSVTHDELDKILKEHREQRAEQHAENRQALQRIETKLDDNEERARETRHEVRDEIHALAVKVAALKAAAP